MSRFGIRNKLKEFVGIRPSREKTPEYSVSFVLPDGTEYTVTAEEKYTIHMASQGLETPIATGCPDGTCGSCYVDVLSGGASLSERTDNENDAYKGHYNKDLPADQRLACHARIMGPGVKARVHAVWTMDSVKGV